MQNLILVQIVLVIILLYPVDTNFAENTGENQITGSVSTTVPIKPSTVLNVVHRIISTNEYEFTIIFSSMSNVYLMQNKPQRAHHRSDDGIPRLPDGERDWEA